MAKKGANKGRAGAAPYRGGGGSAARPTGEDGGLVADIVRQFADPYAFYRELVQNSIDAGASRIGIRILHDAAERVAKIAVDDDGSGMSEAVLTSDLTVLFKSTKEDRDDAIGKFGIGFVSVLAIEPTLVAVDTSTGDGVRHRLELHPDHTWDLLRSTGTGRGTTVTLTVRVDDLDTLLTRSRAALERWCRHARIPITFVAHGDGLGLDATPERIDRPLALGGDALIEIAGRSKDGHTEVVVGLPTGKPSGAFYNRGLLLHEIAEPLPRLPGIAFKVMDGRLEHTLSRDDVRRDAHFAEVLERLHRTVHGPLTRLVHEASVGLSGQDFARLHAAAVRADLALSPASLHVPLAHPIEGQASWPLARVPILRHGPCPTELGEALAARGLPLLALDAERDAVVLEDLARRTGRPRQAAGRFDTLLVPDRESRLPELASHLAALAGEVLRSPSAVAFARVVGRGAARLALGGDLGAGPVLLDADALDGSDPFRLALRPPLVLHTGHPVAEAAARALERGADPLLVATALVRAILAERDLLRAVSASLTEAALRRAVEAP